MLPKLEQEEVRLMTGERQQEQEQQQLEELELEQRKMMQVQVEQELIQTLWCLQQLIQRVEQPIRWKGIVKSREKHDFMVSI
jgi:hypothetical protein